MTDELFDRWYKHYPRRVGRGAARKSFEKLNPSEDLVEQMIRAVQKQEKMRREAKANKQFVPEWKNPSTWLNQECWTDDAPTYEPEVQKQTKLCQCGEKAFMTDSSPSGQPICCQCYSSQFSPPAIVNLTEERKREIWGLVKKNYPNLAKMLIERKNSGKKLNESPQTSETF